jgi:hypothetical protein
VTAIINPPPGLELTDTRTVSLSSGIKILVYGRAGIGKTRLCATAPKPIIISAEGGELSLRDRSIPLIRVTDLETLNKAYDWLVGPAKGLYYTICLDSVSEIAEKILANAKSKTRDGRQAYGILAEQTTELLKKFRDINGACVVMTAKAEYHKDEASGITKWVPSLPGNRLTQGIAYLFDEVFHLGAYQSASGQFIALQTSADIQYDAKDRSGALAFYETPDLTAVFNKIYGV